MASTTTNPSTTQCCHQQTHTTINTTRTTQPGRAVKSTNDKELRRPKSHRQNPYSKPTPRSPRSASPNNSHTESLLESSTSVRKNRKSFKNDPVGGPTSKSPLSPKAHHAVRHTGYFQPQDGKPALWDLDSDYYLHVSGIGDDLIPGYSYLADATPMGARTTLAPIPACREDFSRMKLTSFDKLLERTCSSIRNVRLCREPDQKPGNSGVAPDAAEIQLKSPNWLFGQRKFEESNSAPKVASHETAKGRSQEDKRLEDLYDLSWLSSSGSDIGEEDVFKRYLAMTSVEEANGWYGGTLLGDQDENSEIYKHYAELCQGPAIEPFQDDAEKEKYYGDLLRMGTVDGMDDAAAVEAEMEAALKEYDLIGADLGIVPKACQIFG
ncbi:hypothetical protein RHMOL_Rhmol11G0110500 [Rhododendron molle]|uniref:Uncharacterized protein n=1 Tax=Rhododendron molle TaxID=49168 RepID=A0ACC0LSI5_RHOML|nr:hypothetical protein RHMOL_Rhmol11G0110500 [Rhododendron molle]